MLVSLLIRDDQSSSDDKGLEPTAAPAKSDLPSRDYFTRSKIERIKWTLPITQKAGLNKFDDATRQQQ
ncbi:Hypothetical protein NTJ_01836 [Nesidiocoris tenuis]|uniref:Uncharacterized protein n=1 Tax=Nesidiocoris tenuis TaxID=355587 RepID=A0ABN7ACG3_9HEMI|nr:Hypothetical protein NTJ_01836 [Nesidiocoris tenuis]